MNLKVLTILENATREEIDSARMIDLNNLPNDFGTECQIENGIPLDTPELRLWRSRVGTAYTVENYSYRPARELVLHAVVGELPIRNILEVGCNVGNNLAYFVKRGARAYGIDPIKEVLEDGFFCGAVATAFALPFKAQQFDLVLCSGVLCHIANDYLDVALREIERVSAKYVAIFDYHFKEDEALPFRGTRLLWSRDFIRDTMKHTNLELLRSGFTDRWNGSPEWEVTLWERT